MFLKKTAATTNPEKWHKSPKQPPEKRQSTVYTLV